MPMYALATIPLIKKLKAMAGAVHQVWYADDASGAGDINSLREWWDYLNSLGPNYGYHTNANKTWLVNKGELHDKAIEAFEGTGVHITTEGKTIPRGAHWHRRVHSILPGKQSQALVE